MTYVMGSATFRRFTAGMTPRERDEYARWITVVDPASYDVQVDQDRIGARYEQLLAQSAPGGYVGRGRERLDSPTARRRGATPTYSVVDEVATVVWWPRGAGKTSELRRWADRYAEQTGEQATWVSARPGTGSALPPPWREIGDGVWWAPLDTTVPEPPVPERLRRTRGASKAPLTPEETEAMLAWLRWGAETGALPALPRWAEDYVRRTAQRFPRKHLNEQRSAVDAPGWLTHADLAAMLDDAERRDEARRDLLGVLSEGQEQHRQAVDDAAERVAGTPGWTPRSVLW